jgi:hypothetical protein
VPVCHHLLLCVVLYATQWPGLRTLTVADICMLHADAAHAQFCALLAIPGRSIKRRDYIIVLFNPIHSWSPSAPDFQA